jgi:Uma2 family endonuclease
VVTNDVKLRVAEDVIYYPDVILTCDPEDRGPYILRNPVFVSEVLSPTTSGIDRREKVRLNLQLPFLCSYLIVYQEESRVDHYWRSAPGDDWHFDVQFNGAVEIAGANMRFTLAEIYEGIDLDAPA